MNLEEFYEKQKQILNGFVAQKRLHDCQDDLSEEDWFWVYNKFYNGIKKIKSKLDQATSVEVEFTDRKSFFPRERQAIELPCHTCKYFLSQPQGWMCDKQQSEFPHLCQEYANKML